jgi:NADH-quinone oxidoreductase subunit A
MIGDYAPLVMQLVLALAVAVGGVAASMLLGKKARHSRGKDAAYECGKDPQGPAQPRFSVKFYLVAMIFILFDIEVVFLYPWAASYRELLGVVGWRALWAAVAFLVILEIGHVYAIRKGVFDWNRR